MPALASPVWSLLAFWGAFGLALASPGPNFAVMLATGLREGRAQALRVAAGFGIGEAVWGGAAVFGVAALIAAHPALGTVLRVLGGAYLAWLGLNALRSAFRPAEPPPAAAPPDRGTARGVMRGLGLMLLNGKAGVFWLSLTSLILGANAPLWVGLAAVLGAVAMSLSWHVTLALAFSGGAATRAYLRLRRWIEGALGVVLAGLGLRLITSV
ncbi:MAG: LysE family transporter [Geminicoccaceae bacterium]|nr:LysE family transporter [Geminicoccaceae bacterium]